MAAPMSMNLVVTVNNIYKFLSSNDIVVDENSVFQEPRTHRQGHNHGDICFPLIAPGGCGASVPGSLLFPEYKQFKIKIDPEKVLKELPPASVSWALPIKSCSTSENTLSICFDRQRVFRNTIISILTANCSSENTLGGQKVICITKDSISDDGGITDLTELRTLLAFKGICKVLNCLGYNVMTNCTDVIDSNIRKLHVCHKQTCPERNLKYSIVHCGPVLHITTGLKNKDTSVEEYYRNKKLAFEQMAQARNSYQNNTDQAANISEAAVTGELLWVKLYDNVSVGLSEDSCEAGVSRGATFLLYNQVRLSCIRRKFEQEVENGVYQRLPGVEDIDFGLLTQNEEWELLLLILQFPYWLLNCVYPKGKISLHPVLVGLDKICRVFSVYYRRVRVLTEPRPQLLPVMYARLYLLQCVENILGTGLSIFDIKPLEFM